MALYLGSGKQKLNLNNICFNLNIFSAIPIINGVGLLSFDNYILKDKNGLYLTAKESR